MVVYNFTMRAKSKITYLHLYIYHLGPFFLLIKPIKLLCKMRTLNGNLNASQCVLMMAKSLPF